VNDVDPVRKRQREVALLESQLNSEINGGGNGEPSAPSSALERLAAAAERGSGTGAEVTKAQFANMLSSRSGGAYIPPARLRAMQAEASKDKSSPEYQRLSWDALRKSINGMINKVNISNIKHVVPELFGENLIRGKGLFARSIMRAQASSLPFTPIFATLVAVVNTKLPQVGELVLIRLIAQFRRAYKRNDKVGCRSSQYLLTLDRLHRHVYLHRPPRKPVRRARDCRPQDASSLPREADRRLDRDRHRLYARGWPLPLREQPARQHHDL
jgi:pre-mRNA-splicing factor CWC22